MKTESLIKHIGIAEEIQLMNQYSELVSNRKKCFRCQGLCNPSEIAQFDSDQIGPWSLWQGNVKSSIVIVGQDWGDTSYFKKWEGRDQPSGNPTNENLQELFKTIGIAIKKPRDHQNQLVFFTNLILCLKTGGLQAPVEDLWFSNCSRFFFKPLMSIINPHVIIAMSKKVSDSIMSLYQTPYSKNVPYSSIVERSPYRLTRSISLFPVYHCGAGSVNRNRSMIEQKNDWRRISNWLDKNSFES